MEACKNTEKLVLFLKSDKKNRIAIWNRYYRFLLKNNSGANLRGADLCGANLRGADLCGANLDYSCLPLWCGGTNFILDKKLYTQIVLHLCSLKIEDDECKKHQELSMTLVKQSHRYSDVFKQ
jgi:hypothetical protein